MHAECNAEEIEGMRGVDVHTDNNREMDNMPLKEETIGSAYVF